MLLWTLHNFNFTPYITFLVTGLLNTFIMLVCLNFMFCDLFLPRLPCLHDTCTRRHNEFLKVTTQPTRLQETIEIFKVMEGFENLILTRIIKGKRNRKRRKYSTSNFELMGGGPSTAKKSRWNSYITTFQFSNHWLEWHLGLILTEQ